MKVESEVPEYSRETGLSFIWEEGFLIEHLTGNNSAIIKANKEGLISLARHLLMLTQMKHL